MKKFLIAFIISTFFEVNKLDLIEGFPIWLKDDDRYTDQTSGITFIGENKEKKFFLICDDIGKIHRISLQNFKLKIETIEFDETVEKFLNSLEKKDFEEIVYDKSSGKVYISIEGNGPDFKEEVGIYELKFNDNNVFSNTIIDIEKVKFLDWDIFSKYTSANIGFEGLGISETKIFIGLEGFKFADLFLDSTFIFIVDKDSKRLIKKLSTKDLKIHTICGLYAVNDFRIFGIDRNQQNFFEINFDKNYNVKSLRRIKLNLPLPSRKDLKYVAAIEGICMDNESFVYVVDDPWKKFYIPPNHILEHLSENDKENFKKYIPLLFKYKLN